MQKNTFLNIIQNNFKKIKENFYYPLDKRYCL